MASLENKKISSSLTEFDPTSILSGPYRIKAPTPFDLRDCTKQDILDFFEDSYSLNESLFTVLRTEDAFYMCPDNLRLPLIFYYGHTASVYVNKLLHAGILEERINFHFETIFETGVNENKWDNTENCRMGGNMQWPPLKEVTQFRKQVREKVQEKIFSTPLELPITRDSHWWGVLMAMDHDAVHTETTSVLIHQLPIEHVRRPEGWKQGPISASVPAKENSMVRVDATTVTLGKDWDYPTYGWDGDYPACRVSVPTFEASKYLVSNKEYLEFIDSGGYANEEVWTKEGWNWKQSRQVNHPLFWVCKNGCQSACGGSLKSYSHCGIQQNWCKDTLINTDDNNTTCQEKDKFRYRSLCEVLHMPWDWPVEVNFHEAKAYCNWLGADYRLLSEAEHHAIRDCPPLKSMDENLDLTWDLLLHQKFNLNLTYMTSTPVNLYPPNQLGFHDVFGNVWQWLEDHYNGLPGFQSHYFYDDYSITYFDGMHNVIQGGSWITNGYQASRYARNWFRRHFYQHVGFRVSKTIDETKNPAIRFVKPVGRLEDIEIPFKVKDASTIWTEPENPQFQDESKKSLEERLMEEYSYKGDDNFYKTLAEFCKQMVEKYRVRSQRMLDIGCGCGSITFEAAKQFKQVVGVDNGSNYIGAAYSIRDNGNLEYVRSLINDNIESNPVLCNAIASIQDEIDMKSVTFKQFAWIPNELSNFDLVVQQILDRVVSKKAWCSRLWELIHEKGLVVITSSQGLDEDKLKPIIGSRLKCLESHLFPFCRGNGSVDSAVVTLWCLK